VHAGFAYLVLWAAQLPVGWMNRFGRGGDFSYGMYLYAFPVQQTLVTAGGASWPPTAYVMACFGVCLACAAASWHAIERPALRLKPRRTAFAASAPEDAGLIQGKPAGSGGR